MTPFQPLRRALLALAVLGFAACESNDTPVTPDPRSDSPTVTVNGVKLVTVLPNQRDLFTANANEVERVSSEEGATLTTSDASLFVAPGSVPAGTKITMKPLSDGYVAFRFGPSGLRFDPPAVLTISADKANLSGLDASRLAIAGASDDADDWRVIGGVYDPASNTVTVDIHHFSRYSLCVR